jgi:hypothetical protein
MSVQNFYVFNGIMLELEVVVRFADIAVSVDHHCLKGSSWSWSYGGWIYNFLCNQRLSPHCEFESCSWRGVLDTTLCHKVWQWLAAGRLFSPDSPVSSINKNDRHDIIVIWLKVALNTKNQIKSTILRNLFCGPSFAKSIKTWHYIRQV